MYKHAITLTCADIDAEDLDDMTAEEMAEACPAVTPGATGNYFSIASEERLGTAQTVQFQSITLTGKSWHWGSKFNESGQLLDGNNIVNEGTESKPVYLPANHSAGNTSAEPQTGDGTSTGRVWIEANSRSDLPRSYNHTDRAPSEIYYSWYAAVAESDVDQGYPSDSICPKGWQVPKVYTSLATSYGVINGQPTPSVIYQSTLAFRVSGFYDMNRGDIAASATTALYLASRERSSYQNEVFNFSRSNAYHSAAVQKTRGGLIRCVLKP